MKTSLLAPFLGSTALLSACGQIGLMPDDAARRVRAQFANPIVAALAPAGSADPSVVWRDGLYHYCRSLADGAIGIARAERLQDIGKVPMVTIWAPPAGTAYSRELWAPELQFIDGRWVVYFAASDGRNATHRMYVLLADTADAQGGYTFKGQITDPTDLWAIDGLALEHDGALYFVWSGWRHADAGFPQVLYIARMSNPWTIGGERHEIAAPDRPWETRGAALLEGPAILQRNGRIHLVYSASASWTDDYVLGMLTYEGGDILSAASWVKADDPVFVQRPGGGAHGPGHNSFVRSPDGREDWIVYHAIDRSGGGWSRRSVRAQRIGWRADGMPDFGVPVAPGVLQDEPAGTAARPEAVPRRKTTTGARRSAGRRPARGRDLTGADIRPTDGAARAQGAGSAF